MHAEQYRASQIGGENLRLAGPSGANLLTNQQVIDATTASGLQTNITNSTPHAELYAMKARLNTGIDIGVSTGDYADSVVQAATTVNGLADTSQSAPGTYGPLANG
jgi:hypothetical protein